MRCNALRCVTACCNALATASQEINCDGEQRSLHSAIYPLLDRAGSIAYAENFEAGGVVLHTFADGRVQDSHEHTHTHALALARTPTHARAHAHACTLAHKHTPTHTHTHTHITHHTTHTHTHTHPMHTHSPRT
jgi:hypothetical protein